MRILLINKFLYPNGGSETYVFNIGRYFASHQHEVQYFGMEHEGRCVGNRVNAYTSDMDFHGGSLLAKLSYPLKTIYSYEARHKLRKVLDDFVPEAIHINNFNYQLTPSILIEIKKWKKETNSSCRVIYTAHDYQLVCQNHMMRNPNTNENCFKCEGGRFNNCTKGKCIHGSGMKSCIGAMEGYFWKMKGSYRTIDSIICCSDFMKKQLDTNQVFKSKTISLHNFVREVEQKEVEKKDYILYFGRYSKEKGVETLLEVCRQLPEIPFVFAGKGPLEDQLKDIPNLKNLGFMHLEELEMVIREASFSVYPSEWFENCPFSIMESLMYETPVLAANIGGIPELIEDGVTGELFRSGDIADLKNKIQKLWEQPQLISNYRANCSKCHFDTLASYCRKLEKIYEGTYESNSFS